MKKADSSLCKKLSELLPSFYEKVNLISDAANDYNDGGDVKTDNLDAEILEDVGNFMVAIFKLITDNEPFFKTYVDAQIKRYSDPDKTKDCPYILEEPAFVSYFNSLKKAQEKLNKDN